MADDVEALPSGARQSRLKTRADLMPAYAFLAVAQVLAEGAARYGDGNWVPIPVASHLNHAVTHVYEWLKGDRSEDHLAHAACRLLMAVERQALDDSWPPKPAPTAKETP